MPDILTQYRIITAEAGWTSRQSRAHLRFDGADWAAFLQGLVTNDVLCLEKGQGAYAAYLTPQGRMITDLRLYHRGDWLMAEVGAGRAAEFAGRFETLVFSEDVRVTDVSGVYGQFSVVGTEAAARLAQALELDAETLSTLPLFGHVEIENGFVARTDDTAWPSFDVFVAGDAGDDVRSRVEAAGVAQVSDALVEGLRVEAGRPAFGTDMTEETIPLEAGLLERAISTTKGCYVGQEVIVRVLDRGGGRVARRLVTLAFEPGLEGEPQPGTSLSSDDGEVGHLTSVAFSPRHERLVALAYVRRDMAEAGKRVVLDVAGAPVSAEVTAQA
jgi:folate-binding protein YgfZ